MTFRWYPLGRSALGLMAGGLLLQGCNNVSDQPVQASGSSLCLSDYQRCVNPIFDAVIQGRTGPVTCSAGAICQASDEGKTLEMSAVVFDRLPLESGKP